MTDSPARRPRRWSPGSTLAGFVLGVVLMGLSVVLAVPSFLRHRGDLPLERVLAELSKDMAIPSDATSLQPPRALDDRRMLSQGREAYTGACASCHGATGDGRGMFGTALYPDASDLRGRDTQEKSDGQLFWIVKNGLSFGGMPAFADSYPDETIWAMVAYTRALGGKVGTPAAITPLAVPSPSADQLAFADPHSQDPAARGAAVYMARACASCHGPGGNGPGDLAIGPGRDSLESRADFVEMLRKPDAAMPISYPNGLTDSEVDDLLAYVQTFPPYTPPRR